MFCILRINSHTANTLPIGFLRAQGVEISRFVDTFSGEQLAKRQRVEEKLSIDPNPPHWRFMWTISSDGFVQSAELFDHLNWLVKLVSAKHSLAQLSEMGYECWVSVFFWGNGTGGGPLVTRQCAQLMLEHRLDLGVAFYLDDNA